MKLIKLALISVVVFGGLLWGITLMFPANTVISRAINIGGKASTILDTLQQNANLLNTILVTEDTTLQLQIGNKPFYKNDLYNAMAQTAVPDADTLFFSMEQQNNRIAAGGLALYQLSEDSATVQLFYVFQTPWYLPHQKLKMMMADKAMGGNLDKQLQLLKAKLEE